MKMLPEILAFKLLRKARITQTEKMLVLTGMNFANRETLYEEAKASLRKFKGEDSKGKKFDACIKLEPRCSSENEEVLWAAGYKKHEPFSSLGKRGEQQLNHSRRENFKKHEPLSSLGRRGEQQLNQSRRENFKSFERQDKEQLKCTSKQKVEHHESRLYKGGSHFRSEGQVKNITRDQFSQPRKKGLSPLGRDGNVSRCLSCGSYRHLLSKCPDSWENLSETLKVVEDEKGTCPFTGDQREKDFTTRL
uniref:Uncharacterized protein n=1 Tax=Biomphalaria glabrata TaxID=6526 RepID=A0A2C9M991_BIOGL